MCREHVYCREGELGACTIDTLTKIAFSEAGADVLWGTQWRMMSMNEVDIK